MLIIQPEPRRHRRPDRSMRPPRTAAAALRLLAVILIGTTVSACSGRDGSGSSIPRAGYTRAELVQRVFPEPDRELFGVRGLSVDSTGALHVLDSEDYRVYVLDGEHVRGPAGRQGEGPGEFPDTPAYMDGGSDGVLVTIGGSNSRALFFSNAPAFTGSFAPETLVLQAVFAPGDRIVASTLDSPTDPVIFDRNGRELLKVELGNEDNTIMDHYVMDAGAVPDGRSLLAVAYHFRNRIQVVDLDTGAIVSDFSIDGLPPTSDTRPNPSIGLFADGERPASVPLELPTTTLFQNVLLRGDRIYVHVRDHSAHRGREIHEFTLDGSPGRVILLPEPAFAVEIAPDGRIYATADTATVVNLYALE